MPKGYESKEALMAAYAFGRIKVIDVNVSTPDDVIEIKNIEYGKVGDRSLQLDLYQPKEMKKPAPGLIFIHGGAWKGGDRKIMKYYCVRFAQKGYVTATISYRFSQEAPFPAAVSDTKCAVRWMRANAEQYIIDPDQIGISGNSAGGHLSMMAAYSSDVHELEGKGGNPEISSRVQAVVDFYGPTDLTIPFAIKQSATRDFFGGKTYDEAPALYSLASPITHVTKDDPPTLIFHGTIDEVVPIQQAEFLVKKLTDVGVPVVYEKFDGWPHTMDLAKAVNDRCCYRMDKFFAEHLPLNPRVD